MVAAARASSTLAPSDGDRQADEARDYLDLAVTCLRGRSPTLIAIGGLSGTGKSTIANLAAPGLGGIPGALVLQSDVVRKRLFGVDPETRLPARAYVLSASERTYALLRDQAGAALATGASVIVDAVHASLGERQAIEAVAADAGAPFAGFWLEAPKQTLRQRVALRGRDVSDATVDVVERQDRYAIDEISWERLDARGDPEALAERIRAIAGVAATS